MREKIIEVIERVLELDKGSITPNSVIEEVEGWDSLAHVLIIGELESELGISIPLDEAVEVSTVDDLFEKAGV